MKVLFHGNCQSMAMAEALQNLPNVDIRATPHIWDITDNTVEDIRDYARKADLIISMPISDQYKPGLGTEELLGISDCQFVVHPNIHFEGAHPTFDYVRDNDRKHLDLHKLNNPFGDYFCYLLYTLWSDGKSHAETSELCQLPNPTDLVRGFYMHSLGNLRSREDDAASNYLGVRAYDFVRISPFFGEGDFALDYFDTFNHPSSKLLAKILTKLIENTHLKTVLERHSETIYPTELKPTIPVRLQLPIYPMVRTSLNTQWQEGCFVINHCGEDEHLDSIIAKSYQFFSLLSSEQIRLANAEPKHGLGRLYADHLLSV